MSKLMQQYYKNLAAGMTKSEALRKAKLTFKDKAPQLWASLRLYGQDGLVALRTKFRFPWLWVGISAAILIIGILLFLRFRKADS
jgi:CHAT domain-containing protein